MKKALGGDANAYTEQQPWLGS